MSLTRKPTEEASSTYNNKCLIHNWWEDRYATTDHKLSTTDRILALDIGAIPAPPAELATTKRADNYTRLNEPPPAQVKKPSMYSDATLKARLEAYGTPDSLAYTLGRTIPAEQDKVPERHFETTNMHFFDKLPAAATASNPDYFASEVGSQFHKTQAMKQATEDLTKSGPEIGGRGGQRGEVTRNPREGGNPYGMSVFVDEYAQWGTKLQGMPLEESVRRAQTKYF